MRESVLIILFLFSVKLFCQKPFPITGPKIDTNYYFVLEIRPDLGDIYEYYYTNKDTIEFVIWKNNKRNFVKVMVDSLFNKFIVDEFICAFDSLKIDEKQKRLNQNFSVWVTISHNYSSKQIEISNKFYFDKIRKVLLKLDSMLPTNAQFNLNFDFREYTEKTRYLDTTITIELYHSMHGEHKKNKSINIIVNKKQSEISSYNITEAKMNRKQANLKPKDIINLKFKSISFINAFNISGRKFIKTNDTLQCFTVTYSVPGLFINSSINSLEKMAKNKKAMDLIYFLNSKLNPEFLFN